MKSAPSSEEEIRGTRAAKVRHRRRGACEETVAVNQWVGTNARRVRTALLRWYDECKRVLPWRETSDPYRVWLSEIMLQQTRVESVIGYFERFTAAFPTVRQLAAAPLDDVLRLWSGLGYYTRAKNLHAAARVVVDAHNGEFPSEANGLRALPGVGRYTAGAVASIAFGRRAAVVDGNVKRVLARWLNLQKPVDDRAVVEELWRLAEALVPVERPGDFNQALMELGAVVCAPRRPRCEACPMRRLCAAREEGNAGRIPVRSAKRTPREIEAVALAIWVDERLLVMRRPRNGLLGGLWGLPQVDGISPEATSREIERRFAETTGLRVKVGHFLGEVQHQFTHRLLRMRIHAAESRSRRSGDSLALGRWVAAAEFESLPVSTLDRRVMKLIRMAGNISGMAVVAGG